MKRFAFALTLLACRAAAHDFWIEPSSFRPAVGDRVTAALRVGQKLRGDPVPRMPSLIDRFTFNGSPMPGMTGRDPAGIAVVANTGVQWIGYQSTASEVTQDRQKFAQYLREEGLQRIVAGRENRERFYRCAKALIAAGGDTSGSFDAPLGFTLELVPRKNPYAMRAGDALPVALLFRGKPAAGVLVVGLNRDDPDAPVRARTDAKGRATLRLVRGGFWLIKAVHMEAAPPGAGVDWESWWASVTFDLQSRH
ncbi:MAG: DUF4198 domain-containing protein [Acidobacteriota bacterium]